MPCHEQVEDDLIARQIAASLVVLVGRPLHLGRCGIRHLVDEQHMADRPQERLIIDAEELPSEGLPQVGKRCPDERIATAKMMVQETQRSAQREGVQPEAHLGKLDRHRIQVNAVDAPLENMPLEQVHIGQLGRIDRDTLVRKRCE